MNLLSAIIWFPIIAGFIILTANKLSGVDGVLRFFAKTVSFISLGLICWVLFNFDNSTWQMQYVENYVWFPSLDINYALGIDGFALPLVILTIFMTMLVLLIAPAQVEAKSILSFDAIFLIMQGLMCGVFLATDAVLFYLFFEAMMIPMFLLIGLWGGERRVYATFKFFLYTLFGSMFLLIAILYLHNVALTMGDGTLNTFAISTFQNLDLNIMEQKWLFWALLLAFAVKIPMWPIHTWLPDAHTEAPTGGSVILAAITLKIGAYGMLRFLLPVVPDAALAYSAIIIALSLIAIVYIGLVAIAQQDMKKLIAYSSIAHMGFVTLGLFAAVQLIAAASSDSQTSHANLGIEGALVQMVSHGFVSGALFLCVGVLYARTHSRSINDYGGIIKLMPVFAAFFMLFALANVGLPGTSGFIGEFFIILASFDANAWFAFIAACTLVLSVCYTLWMYKRVVFGTVNNQTLENLSDLTFREKFVLTLLALAVILIGVYPNPLLQMMHSTTDHFVTQLVINN